MSNKIHWIPPLILIFVFIHQFYLVQTHNLTQWKGGGFGMFSTVDKQTERVLRIYLVKNGNLIPAVFPFSVNTTEAKLKTKILPAESNIRILHSKVSLNNWYCIKADSISINADEKTCLFADSITPKLDKELNRNDNLLHVDSIKYSIESVRIKKESNLVTMDTISSLTLSVSDI